MSDTGEFSIFDKFLATRDLKPPTLPKKAKRTIGNPAVIAAAQEVYSMPDAAAPTQEAAAGMTGAMGMTGPWGKPNGG